MSANSPTTASARRPIAALLAHVLAEESQLSATTRNYLWHVPGSPLQSLKRLFAEQGRQIDRWINDLSARLGALGAACTGVTADAAAAETDDATVGVPAILERHEAIAAELREAVEALRNRDPDGDAVMLLSGLLEFHETSAWMLRLLLESPERSRIVPRK